MMRTTVDLEEHVLLASKEIARQRGISIGKVLSDLTRQALSRQAPTMTRSGVPLFPIRHGSGVVALELVDQLRDEAP